MSSKKKFGQGALLFDGLWGDEWKANYKGSKGLVRCADSHKPLSLPDGLEIYGGSCWTPKVTDADIYIGFDRGMNFTNKHWPWMPGHEVLFAITDQAAPKSHKQFLKLVEWTAAQLKDGKKVHAGCIGGHGRTGTFFVALVLYMGGEKKAIQYVRENYCKRAVESESQVAFLKKHYGAAPATVPKRKVITSGGKGTNVVTYPAWGTPKAPKGAIDYPKDNELYTGEPLPNPLNIWGDEK